MSKKMFSTEEMAILQQNPFTFRVTTNQISFTKEFKEIFIAKYNTGVIPRQILTDCGYEPEMFGDRRIWGISQYIRTQYSESAGTFSNSSKVSRKSKGDTKPLSEKEELRQLRQEVDYLKQEVEFLKKISSIRITRK